MKNLKVGDIVKLNSGGPDSTVTNIENKIVTVNWVSPGTSGSSSLVLPEECFTLVSKRTEA
jgi:uncharacterized protein YodC (DUF2158 family)